MSLDICVINPFDPLPGDALGETRYASFCRALAEAGHRVTWHSSDWSHALKARRDGEKIRRAGAEAGFQVVLHPTRPYQRNVGIARMASHRGWVGRVVGSLQGLQHTPDVVLASMPPPELGCRVGRWVRARGAVIVLDVQDLWPETFVRLLPAALRPLGRLLFRATARRTRQAYGLADGLVGVAQGYVDHALRWLRSGTPSKVLHLGTDLAAFDANVAPLEEIGLAKPAGLKWVFLSGSFTTYLDLELVLETMQELQRRGAAIQLMAVGYGPGEPYLRRQVQLRDLANVTVMGRQGERVYATVAGHSDAAFLPIHPKAFVLFPNRVFPYLAAGLPVVSTVRGELERLLADRAAGATCEATPTAAADALEAAVRGSDPAVPGRRPRPAWVEQFDRRRIAADLVAFVEEVAARRPRGAKA